MKNLEKINETIIIIDRYSDYLYRKAWSKILIIWGVLLPITFVLVSQSENLAMIFDIEESFFKFFVTSLIIVIGIGITLYTFISINKVKLSETKESKDINFISRHHGKFIGIIWFLFFLIPNYVPEPLNIVTYVIGCSAALITSYLILQNIHGNYKELLLTSTLLLISTIPIVIISIIDMNLAEISVAITFAIAFMVGGIYSAHIATKILDG